MVEVDQGERILVKGEGNCVIEQFTIREPNPDEVLIETVSSLISAGTELGNQEVSRSDFHPGYSNAGRVIAMGKDVRGLSISDRVLSLGNHATHVTVPAKPEEVALIPDGVSFDHASFGVLGSVAMNGVRKAKIELGESVAISGMGLVGQLSLQLASQTGCESLLASDFCDLRLRIAKELGATHICNLTTCNIRENVRELTGGRGLDVIIEASGYPEALLMAFELARIGGRIILLGSIWNRKIEVDFMDFHLKDLTLIGAHQPKCPTVETIYFPWTQQYNRREILRMISDGRLSVGKLITHKLHFTEISEAYRLLRDEKDKTLGIVLDWER
jgi:L-iditol 2-dehydrogenase